MSAPENPKKIKKLFNLNISKYYLLILNYLPGLSVASLPACSSKFLFTSNLIGFKWTKNILFLPSKSGNVTYICLSNLPGLIKAGSKVSGIVGAPIKITFESVPKPSISTNSWFKV